MTMMYSLNFNVFLKIKIEVNNKAVCVTLVRKALCKCKERWPELFRAT